MSQIEKELKFYLEWLSTFEFHGIKPGLYRIQKILKKLGNPHLKYSTVHVTGTNGKGSTSAMLESLGHELGLKVGLYSSPHFFRLNDRFRIAKKPISDERLCEALKILKAVLKDDPATYFELTTALAFLVFAEEEVDLAIVECGMGGRLDATNVIRPEVCIITSVSFDHTKYLGNTLTKIAYEKAGIIKRCIPAVIGFMPKEASETIIDRAKVLNSPYYLWGIDFRTELNGNAWHYWGERVLTNLELNLQGLYQGYNLASTLKATEVLVEKGLFPWQEGKVREALRKVYWPGRYQKIYFQGKTFLLDVAHNEEGVKALRESLIAEDNHCFKLLLLGVTNEDGTKPYAKLFEILEEIFDEAYLCEFYSPRRIVTINDWAKVLKDKSKVSFFKDLTLAIEKAVSSSYRGIVVSGSVYFVAECLKVLSEVDG